jgi:hypothetical protein
LAASNHRGAVPSQRSVRSPLGNRFSGWVFSGSAGFSRRSVSQPQGGRVSGGAAQSLLQVPSAKLADCSPNAKVAGFVVNRSTILAGGVSPLGASEWPANAKQISRARPRASATSTAAAWQIIPLGRLVPSRCT